MTGKDIYIELKLTKRTGLKLLGTYGLVQIEPLQIAPYSLNKFVGYINVPKEQVSFVPTKGKVR